MTFSTILTLTGVPGAPNVQLALPGPLRLGDRVRLAFKLRRTNGGRDEMLDVSGEWRVTSAFFDGTSALPRQVLQVESTTSKGPAWRAIRKQPVWERRLAPARSPKTVVA